MLPFDHRHLETRIFILGGDAPRAAQDSGESSRSILTDTERGRATGKVGPRDRVA